MIKYEYYNRNPDGKRISDCVSRAISLATGLSYKTTNRLLSITAEKFGCDKLCVCCYKHLLTHYFGFKRYNCKPGTLVSDVVYDFSDSIVIIRIQGHLTCAKYGTLLDTWSCLDREADCLWVVS